MEGVADVLNHLCDSQGGLKDLTRHASVELAQWDELIGIIGSENSHWWIQKIGDRTPFARKFRVGADGKIDP